MSDLLKKLSASALMFVMLVSGAALMAGCETTAGAGRDLEKAGEKIEDAAD